MAGDDELLYWDLSERETMVVNALADVKDIEVDAMHGGWADEAIVTTANAAATALNDLLAAIQACRERLAAASESALGTDGPPAVASHR